VVDGHGQLPLHGFRHAGLARFPRHRGQLDGNVARLQASSIRCPGGVPVRGATARIVSLIIVALLLASCGAQASQTTASGGTSLASTSSPTPSATPAATAVPVRTASPTPMVTAAPPRHRHRHRPTPSPTPLSQEAPWCTASASYNAQYNEADIFVRSNQPNQIATAMAGSGDSLSSQTDATGDADITLYADSGDSVSVRVGEASCSAIAG